MSGFTKLVPEIIQSSIWNESSDVRVVWITLLATKDETGYVRGDAKTIARMANVPIEAAVEALRKFQEPDESSHTPDNEGRRIGSVPGGWVVLNHDLYRLPEDQCRERTRERVRRFRAKCGADQKACNVTVTLRNADGALPSASASTSSSALSGEGDAGKGTPPAPPSPTAPDRMPPDGWPVETVMEMAANPTVGCPRAAAEAYFACRARTDPPWTMDGKSGPRAVGRTLTALRHDLTTWARVTWPNMQADAQRRTGAPPASKLVNTWHDPNPDLTMRKAF